MDRVAEAIPPEILAFAQAIRAEFGPGVKLRKGLKWPGGCDPKAMDRGVLGAKA